MTITEVRSIVIVGGPAAGKTNFIGRLWLALRRGDGLLAAPEDPEDVEYVESLAAHLLRGDYAPRTDKDKRGDFAVPVVVQSGDRTGEVATLLVPDVAGEHWNDAAIHREIDENWIEEFARSGGALLFVRVAAPENRSMLNWVVSEQLMRANFAKAAAARQLEGRPTEIFLCDMLNLLDAELGREAQTDRPKVALVITAWDRLPRDEQKKSPMSFLIAEYPMLAGRLLDEGRIDTMLFGVSLTGGDLKDDTAHRDACLAGDIGSCGYVVYEDGDAIVRATDLSAPVAWALGVGLPPRQS